MNGRQRAAVSVAFLAFGTVVGSVIPRLPGLKDHLRLHDSQIGIALLAFSSGAVAGSLAARLFLGRGARFYVRAGTAVLCAALIGPGLAANLIQLVVSFLLIGLCAGFIDVLENAQGAELERIAGTPLINGFHGFWSLGAMAGAVIAGAAAYLNVAPLTQFVATAAIVAGASWWFLRELPDTRTGGEAHSARGQARRVGGAVVLAVSVLTFAGIIVEGSSADWSSLYLRELSHASNAIAAGGYAGFSLAALAVRFRADVVTSLTSTVTVVRLGAGVAVAGLALAIASPALPTAVLGFALVGMGTSVILPLAFAAGANLGRSGTPLSIVMSSGYAGALVAPALIGGSADKVGLRVAMLIPLLAGVTVLALAGYLNQASPQTKRITASMPR